MYSCSSSALVYLIKHKRSISSWITKDFFLLLQSFLVNILVHGSIKKLIFGIGFGYSKVMWFVPVSGS